MAPVRNESSSLKEIEQTEENQNSLVLLQESGFLPFLQKFDGFYMVVVLELMRTFKGGLVKVSSLEFKIMEKSIAQDTCLPTIGEQWFKKERLGKKRWHQFVDDIKIKVDWKKGLLQSAMINKWRDLLFISFKFVTCEGCYTLAFMYHLQLLLHFELGELLNFPYYLLRSLTKMVKGVHSGKGSLVSNMLYHHALIMILIKNLLEEKGVT